MTRSSLAARHRRARAANAARAQTIISVRRDSAWHEGKAAEPPPAA
jgi:hypothetical protein